MGFGASTPIPASTGCMRASRKQELEWTRDVPTSRQGAGRHQLDQRHGLYARQRRPITTNGDSAAAPAGTGTACCRTSRKPKTRNAVRAYSTASADRSTSPTSRIASSWRIAGSKRRSRPGCPPSTTSTTASRKAQVISRAPPANAAAGARPPPICGRRATAQISSCARMRRRRASWSRTAAPPVSSSSATVSPHTARARGEVIVCGGVFNSPQLLQLSGIGPGALLQGMGIPVVRDVPAVGADLQDHFYVRLAFRCTRSITMNEMANNLPRKVVATGAVRAVSSRATGSKRHHRRRLRTQRSTPGAARTSNSISRRTATPHAMLGARLHIHFPDLA